MDREKRREKSKALLEEYEKARQEEIYGEAREIMRFFTKFQEKVRIEKRDLGGDFAERRRSKTTRWNKHFHG